MKARGIKTAVVLVAAMMISSALMAAPSSRSNNCATPSTDGTVWGGGGSGPLKASSSPTSCAPTQITLSSSQTHSENGHGIAYAFGKMVGGLWTSFEGAIWGGSGYVPPPK